MDSSVTLTQPLLRKSVSNQWTSDICDCFQDLPQCCFATWCLSCFACKTTLDAGESLCLPLLDFFGLFPPIGTAIRLSVRHRYGLEGTIFDDCVYAFFCGPCSWCQVAREIKTRSKTFTA